MNLKLEHVALSVSDMERSLGFYCGVLGFEIIRRIEAAPGEKLGTITAMPGCRAHIVHLMSGDFMFELFQYVEPEGNAISRDRNQADLGYNHIGFRSIDIHADYQQLKDRGVDFLSEPVEFRPGAWVVYFHGPDGEVCELRCILS
ncbi:MAG: VOC family protein [Candidatus Hydrogenedentes bacterium]|nr:VOC family protein [Candidatus Hydrogenedentota bacterium]